MKTQLFIAALCVTACAAEKPILSAESKPVITSTAAVEPQAPEAQPQPDTDPLGDVEWSANPAEDAMRTGGEAPIDLDMGEEYEDVQVNGKTSPKPIACKADKDCARMSTPKEPGERRCVKKKCVFIRTPITELF